MNYHIDKVQVPLWLIVVFVIAVATGVLVFLFYYLDPNDIRLFTLVGGVITGLIVFLLTFVTMLTPIREADKFRRMGVKGLLANRHKQEYYRKLVISSETRVDVMGASCSRFVQDFLDLESDDKVLVDALNTHNQLKVRLLIPDTQHMGEEVQHRVEDMLKKLEAVEQRFGDRVQLRRFPNYAHHSFVVVDDNVVAGPIFQEDKSKYAPAVHVSADTTFGKKYISHFDVIWSESSDAS